MNQDSEQKKPTSPAGVEQRSYQRFSTCMPGSLLVDGMPGIECEVLDYCAGGMLISLGNRKAGSHLVPGKAVRMHINLPGKVLQRPIAIPSSVAWMGGERLGLVFSKPVQSLVDFLQKQTVLTQPHVSGSAVDSRPYLVLVHDVAQDFLPGMLQTFLDDALSALFEIAEQMTLDTERQQIYADITALQKNHSGKEFSNSIIEKFFPSASEGEQSQADERTELSLLDQNEFESWLDSARAASELERFFGNNLTILGSRLQAVSGQEPDDVLDIPFGPKHFTEALKAISERLEWGSASRSAAFKLFVQFLKKQLVTFYQQINEALDEAGAPAGEVSASPRRGVHTPTHHASVSPVANQEEAAAAGSEGASISGLARLPANTVAVDAQALQKLMARDAEMRGQQARQMLDKLTEIHGKDPENTDWWHLLDEPLIAAARSEPTFFQNADHPMHSIVDALDQLQLFSPLPVESEEAQELRHQIGEVLEPLSQGDLDNDVLQSVANNVGRLTHTHSEQYQRNVARVAEASEGRDRIRRARDTVRQELEKRYAGRQVPQVVPDLIQVGWRSVLELAWLNGDVDGSQTYSRHMASLDAVVACLGGEAYSRAPISPDRNQLVEEISRELETTAIEPYRRAQVEKCLSQALLRGGKEGALLVEMPTFEIEENGTAGLSRPGDISEEDWKRALATCATVRLGDQVLLAAENPDQQKLRVAWIRSDRELFTLVDRRGVRARDFTLSELALGLHVQELQLEPVDGQPLSQRAVDQMLDAMEHRLSDLAATDSITGLMGRQQFHTVLEGVLNKSRSVGQAGALVWVDIDQFKLINEIHGYNTGDRLLAALAGVLEQLSDKKVLGHMGADRFAILFEHTALVEVEGWCEALRMQLKGLEFDWSGPVTALTVSVGAVQLSGESVSELMAAAESALSAAKAGGGDQIHIYRDDDPDINRQRDSVKWVARVDEALMEGELHLRCQPIVPVRSGEGIAPHYEVLLGVSDASHEALPILEFIEAAERYKRMQSVDRWVTESVFDWISKHRARMAEFHGFAVNLSGQTASDPAFVEFVRQEFQRTGINPEWISFEVTETAAVSSITGTASIIHDLKNLGCKVALDDFGSGLASFSYLRDLPVDWLKIDGVFVRDIVDNRDDYAVVKSINEIGHFLGKQTIAEYVKDQPTLNRVSEIGVDFAQGFGISPPILLNDLLDMDGHVLGETA